jgi:predicted nucleic acid-binding protein
VKAVDSNLLVYATLAAHPASPACDQYLSTEPVWLINIVNLIEMHRVLIGVYEVAENDADAKLVSLLNALVVETLSSDLVAPSLSLRNLYGIDFNDAVLLQTCRQRVPAVLATDDSRLAPACTAEGITVENPIDAMLRGQMAQWESAHLPSKGLPRVLTRVHRWIEAHDPTLAADIHSATQALSRLV